MKKKEEIMNRLSMFIELYNEHKNLPGLNAQIAAKNKIAAIDALAWVLDIPPEDLNKMLVD